MAEDASEIRLEGIVKRFGSIEAVRGVSLEIRRGEFFTLLGPSGSGKSTLLHVMGGFEVPSEGRVYFLDRDVTEVPANRRPSSTVFQDLALFPHMTVGQNVEYGLRIRRLPPDVRRRRTERLLEVVGLAGFHGRDANKLSGGQRQRVALARSLVVEPSVLLLDEPLTGLDELLRQQMQEELRRIHAELGTTFVAVTHNQEEALSISTRVAVLHEGRLEQVGTPRELYEEPLNAFVADFVGSANLLRGPVALGAVPVITVAGVGFHCGRIAPGWRHAGEAMAAVRPERIRVGAAAADQPNRCCLRVESVVYSGSMLEYRLRFADGQGLRARRIAGGDVEPPAVGSELEVGWAVEDTRLLPEAAAVRG
jgi:spermidine/putrescine transport system ATP-binding protein